MIIGSVAAVGIMALGGASYVNANGASNEESDAIELVKKKKHRHNSFYQRQHDYNRQNNDRQQYNNSGAERLIRHYMTQGSAYHCGWHGILPSSIHMAGTAAKRCSFRRMRALRDLVPLTLTI